MLRCVYTFKSAINSKKRSKVGEGVDVTVKMRKKEKRCDV